MVQPLSSEYDLPDPLGIRSAARRVLEAAQSVRLDPSALDHLATLLPTPLPDLPAWDHPLHWRGTPEQTANYVLLLDALNFCFWGEPRWRVTYQQRTYDGYWALAAALRKALENGMPLYDMHYLQTLSDSDIAHIFSGEGTIPLLDQRICHIREVATGLTDCCNGSFLHLVETAVGSAVTLVELLVPIFPSFDDRSPYQDFVVPFYKRAQLLCADIAGAFQGHPPARFTDLESLTAFADYKLPQVLRWFGALRYAPELARRIDAHEEIPAGLPEEVEIRAATICAVEELVARLRAQDVPATAWQVDWALWKIGQTLPPDAPPYHRTRTHCY